MSRSLFTPRRQIKPVQYPELLGFKDAIRQSYWLHTEFNFTGDINDFKSVISDVERSIVSRTMLAIGQIEVTVKRFWGDLYRYLPIPEIDDVGGTFAESEIRHKDAYSFLLEKLGLNDLFNDIEQVEPLMERIHYMEEFQSRKNTDRQGFTLALILFSLFVEHTSLFGQFLIMMSFNKYQNQFKGLSNAVEATSKEEEIHGRFGIALYHTMKEENPELFTQELYDLIKELANKAVQTELRIIDWIFEEGELSFLSKDQVRAFVMHRFNNSLIELGIDAPFAVDIDLLKSTEWFDVEVLAFKDIDFFAKRPTDYSKRQKSITKRDIF